MQQRALSAILVAIEERLTAIEDQIAARSAPAEQVEQALKDILDIYNSTGQSASVIRNQHGQIQALSEAYQQLSNVLREHDHNSRNEREELRGLLIQLRELARKQVAQLDNLEREAGMSQAERARPRDVRPEESGAP